MLFQLTKSERIEKAMETAAWVIADRGDKATPKQTKTISEMARSMFGDGMCGRCIAFKVMGYHDPKALSWVCGLCHTKWQGTDPDRRGAVEATRRKKAERKANGS